METEHVIVKKLEIRKELQLFDKTIESNYLTKLEEKIEFLEQKIQEITNLYKFGSENKGLYSHSEGSNTLSIGECSHSEGGNTKSIGKSSHAEGNTSMSIGDISHSEGSNNKSYGECSHTEGNSNITYGKSSHSEGICNSSNGDYSHTEGECNIADGISSHCEGSNNHSIGISSHSGGIKTLAEGDASYSGGFNSQSIGNGSFTHGLNNIVYKDNGVAFGENTISNNSNEFVCGSFNTINDLNRIFCIGIGDNDDNRKDAISIYTNGLIKLDTLELNNIILKNTPLLTTQIPIIVDKRIQSKNSNTTINYLDIVSKLDISVIKNHSHDKYHLNLQTNSNELHPLINEMTIYNSFENVEYISLEELCLTLIGCIKQLHSSLD